MKTITKNLFALILIAIFAVACGGGADNSLSGQLSGREFSINTSDLDEMVDRCFSRARPTHSATLSEMSSDSSSELPGPDAPPPSSGSSPKPETSPSPSIKVSFSSDRFKVKWGSEVLLEGTWTQLSENTIKISAQGTEAVITVQVRGDSLSLGLANHPVNADCSR